MDGLGFLAYPLDSIPVGIESVEQRGKAGKSLLFEIGSILVNLTAGEIKRLAVAQQHDWRAFRLQHRKGIGEMDGKGIALCFIPIGAVAVRFTGKPEHQLPAKKRRETGKVI